MLRSWAQSLTPLAPITRSLAATLVLLGGADLAAVASVQAGRPAANVTGTALEGILAFLPGCVPELGFTPESARALAVVYPAAVLGLVQLAGLSHVDETSDSEDEECTKNNPSLLHLGPRTSQSVDLRRSVW